MLKSSASLGTGWVGNESGDFWRGMVSGRLQRLGEMRVVTSDVAWCPVSQKKKKKKKKIEKAGCLSRQ